MKKGSLYTDEAKHFGKKLYFSIVVDVCYLRCDFVNVFYRVALR